MLFPQQQDNKYGKSSTILKKGKFLKTLWNFTWYLQQVITYNIYTHTHKLLPENISKTYKKSNLSNICTINVESKIIAQDLKIDESIEQYNKKQSFITLKDHKEKFKINPKCRLINPAKSEKGIVSNEYIDIINKVIWEKNKCKPLEKHWCSSYVVSKYWKQGHQFIYKILYSWFVYLYQRTF